MNRDTHQERRVVGLNVGLASAKHAECDQLNASDLVVDAKPLDLLDCHVLRLGALLDTSVLSQISKTVSRLTYNNDTCIPREVELVPASCWTARRCGLRP